MQESEECGGQQKQGTGFYQDWILGTSQAHVYVWADVYV